MSWIIGISREYGGYTRMTLEEIQKKIDKYEKLAEKNYYDYQQTGDPKYDKYNEKYEELADVYRMAYKYKAELRGWGNEI